MDKYFHLSEFCLDAISGVFEGYTDDVTWNGWACPCFTRDIAEQILSASTANGYSYNYDEQRGFIVKHQDDYDSVPETFAAQIIEVNGQSFEVFAIGAYSWTWEPVESLI